MSVRRTSWLILALILTAACATDLELESTAQPQISLNQISLNQISLNALTANAQALDLLREMSLQDAVEDNYLRAQMSEENARVFMSYLTSCALGYGDSLTWSDPFSADVEDWSGGLGLCRDWLSDAPTDACLEIVTACLLSRNNAFGVRVMFSARAELLGGGGVPMSSSVAPDTAWKSGNTINSFVDCAAPIGGLRDCGWDPISIGTCTPGKNVTASAGCGALGASTGDTMLRACPGIRGCDSWFALDQNDDTCGTAPSVSFVCPATGFYNTMGAPYHSGAAAVAFPEAFGGGLPALEQYVFATREAGFYGNLFESGHTFAVMVVDPSTGIVSATSSVPSGPGPHYVFEDTYACSDIHWSTPDAYMSYRLCATVDGAQLCLAEFLGPCHYSSTDDPANRCGYVDGPEVTGDGDFQDCAATGPADVYDWPVTVFLNQPCDLMPRRGRRSCQRGSRLLR